MRTARPRFLCTLCTLWFIPSKRWIGGHGEKTRGANNEIDDVMASLRSRQGDEKLVQLLELLGPAARAAGGDGVVERCF